MEVTMIKQRKKSDCSCSGHPSGQPKVSRGPCYGYGVRSAVRERIRGKRIERTWLAAIELEDVED
jgi:hypothetical protein